MKNIMGEYICPHCKNPVCDVDALLCHFCGESLQRSGKGLLSKIKYQRPKKIVVVVICLVLLSFILLMLR